MGRLHVMNLKNERRVEVVLSRRNLLALHKLDMPGSNRQIENNDCCEDGEQTPYYDGEERGSELPRTVLVVRCEDDREHYGKREAGPGFMHPETKAFVAAHGGAAGEVMSIEVEPDDG